jgi:hypothetical protein
MARRLAGLGVRNTATLSRERANQLRDMCLKSGWHPTSIASEPETLPPAAVGDRRTA